MTRSTLTRIARRVAVLAATGAVLGIAVGTVQLAATWRVAEAPLDVAPVGMTTIDAELAAESERAAGIEARLMGVAGQVSELQAAVLAAGGTVDGDTQAAKALREQLAVAKGKLAGMQKQLRAAQARLEALNDAAARQAALNRRAASGGSGPGGAEDRDDDDHEDDDEEEEEHDDD